MKFSDGFEKKVKEARGRRRGAESPARALLSAWEYLVQECENGYDGNIDEMTEDFQNRESIEKLLTHESLAGQPEMAIFRNRVEQLDRRFQALLLDTPVLPPNEVPWWRAYPLRIGSKELADDYWNMARIKIEVVP